MNSVEGSGAELDTAGIVNRRNGQVLSAKSILKSDHFPGCQNKALHPLIEGCPNYRQVPGLPVFGVAIPTTQGLRAAIGIVRHALPVGTRIVWNNMREEPLIYINGRPFVVRDVGNPFGNLEYTGVHPPDGTCDVAAAAGANAQLNCNMVQMTHI